MTHVTFFMTAFRGSWADGPLDSNKKEISTNRKKKIGKIYVCTPNEIRQLNEMYERKCHEKL